MANENCNANIPRGHKIGFALYNTAKASAFTKLFSVNSFGLKGITNKVTDDGIKGTIFDVKGEDVVSTKAVSGAVTMNPRPEDLEAVCHAIFGGPGFTAGILNPGEMCGYHHWGELDPKLDVIYRYDNCVTSSATWSASDSSPLLLLNWNVEGQTETLTTTGGVAAFPSAIVASSEQPFVFRQATLTFGGTVTRMKSFNYTVNHNLDLSGFYNSLTREEMPSGGQTHELSVELPWDVAAEVAKIGSIQTVAATVEFVAGTSEFNLTFPNLEFVIDKPELSGRSRINNTYSCMAKMDPDNAIPYPVQIEVVNA